MKIVLLYGPMRPFQGKEGLIISIPEARIAVKALEARLAGASGPLHEQLAKDIAYLNDCIGRTARTGHGDEFPISHDRDLVDQIVEGMWAVTDNHRWDLTERHVADRALRDYKEVAALDRDLSTPPSPDTPNN
jgi:hypothetical protein